MDTKKFFIILIIVAILSSITAMLILRLRESNQNAKKSYEQGLQDGSTRTLLYLNGKEFTVGDTIRFRASELDSVLHQIKK